MVDKNLFSKITKAALKASRPWVPPQNSVLFTPPGDPSVGAELRAYAVAMTAAAE